MEHPDWSNPNLTFGDILHPAMKAQTQEEAQIYLAAYVHHIVVNSHQAHETALSIAKSNIGYFAGYYDDETRERVQRLFGAEHPIFGKATPSTDEALAEGLKRGRASQ